MLPPLAARRVDWNRKNDLLTYSRCNVPPDVCGRALSDRFGLVNNRSNPLDEVHVVREAHADGGNHLHALISFASRKRITNPLAFDILDEKEWCHPNVAIVRSWDASCLYLSKTGNEIYHWYREGCGSSVASFAAAVIRGEKYKEEKGHHSKGKFKKAEALIATNKGNILAVREAMPGFFMQHLKKIREYSAFYQLYVAEEEVKKPWVPLVDIAAMEHRYNRVIAEWLNSNLFVPRFPKQKQLYIWGEPDTGKTSFVNWLEDFCFIWRPSRQTGGFQDAWRPNHYNLVVIDELEEKDIPISFLKILLGGGVQEMPMKGLPSATKRERLPVVVLSQSRVDELYPKCGMASVRALESRVIRVQMKQGDFITVLGDVRRRRNHPNDHEVGVGVG